MVAYCLHALPGDAGDLILRRKVRRIGHRHPQRAPLHAQGDELQLHAGLPIHQHERFGVDLDVGEINSSALARRLRRRVLGQLLLGDQSHRNEHIPEALARPPLLSRLLYLSEGHQPLLHQGFCEFLIAHGEHHLPTRMALL